MWRGRGTGRSSRADLAAPHLAAPGSCGASCVPKLTTAAWHGEGNDFNQESIA